MIDLRDLNVKLADLHNAAEQKRSADLLESVVSPPPLTIQVKIVNANPASVTPITNCMNNYEHEAFIKAVRIALQPVIDRLRRESDETCKRIGGQLVNE